MSIAWAILIVGLSHAVIFGYVRWTALHLDAHHRAEELKRDDHRSGYKPGVRNSLQ